MLDISELFHCQFELNSVFFCKRHYPVELCKLLNMKNICFIIENKASLFNLFEEKRGAKT